MDSGPDVPSFLAPDAPLAVLTRGYLTALLDGDEHQASTLILDAVATGVPITDIYLYVFQPAQYEVGRLWATHDISVAQAHYCTAATQVVMSKLYPHIFAVAGQDGTLVATCVAGDLHEIGNRMVADFFEMDGWDTHYLGANTPVADVVTAVIDRKADVLAISVTISAYLPEVSALIKAVRARGLQHRCRSRGWSSFQLDARLVAASGCRWHSGRRPGGRQTGQPVPEPAAFVVTAHARQGVALLCDAGSIVRRVIRDELGLPGLFAEGLSLAAAIAPTAADAFEAFHRAVIDRGAAFDRELPLRVADGELTLCFSGVADGELFYVVAKRSTADQARSHKELLLSNNEQTNALRAAWKELGQRRQREASLTATCTSTCRASTANWPRCSARWRRRTASWSN